MTKYYASPRITGEIIDCSMPMTFDTYNNCSFKCLYCFSQFQRGIGQGKEDYFGKKNVSHVNVANVKLMFTYPDKYAGAFASYIKARKVMQWGGLSDQFDNNERKFGTSLELLKFFKDIDYPLCFSTKATWWTRDERYMSLFRGQKNWNVKVSIITLDGDKARMIERGVPSPDERLEAIRTIAEAGCGGATLRLRPFIIGISNPTHVELIHRAADMGATACSTEFLCLERRFPGYQTLMPIFEKACGFDLFALYEKNSSTTGYMRLNRTIKRPFIEEMEQACRQVGMRFYVSDAHFKERCANGSCCGLPESWNYSRGQFTEALLIARRRGVVTWADIRDDIDALHGGYLWNRAPGYNTGRCEAQAKFYGMTMAQYMHWLWNSPRSAHSPAKCFGNVLVPDGRDENGDIRYRYQGE